jgi:hypothetical protein
MNRSFIYEIQRANAETKYENSFLRKIAKKFDTFSAYLLIIIFSLFLLLFFLILLAEMFRFL